MVAGAVVDSSSDSESLTASSEWLSDGQERAVSGCLLVSPRLICSARSFVRSLSILAYRRMYCYEARDRPPRKYFRVL